MQLRTICDASSLNVAGSILNTVFEYKVFTFDHFEHMMELEGLLFYIAEYDGLPVGACMCQHGDDFINISWVGTLPGYRKLGIAGYLIHMAEHEGILCDKKISVLEARPGAVEAYRRVGYKEYCRGIELVYKNDKCCHIDRLYNAED